MNKFSIIKTILVAGAALLLFSCANTSSTSASSAKHSDELVLVMGITGNQGGGVAEALLDRGFNVRGVSRNITSERSQAWIARGVDMVQGDFNDHDSIKSAVQGANHLFLNITEQTPNFVDAAKHAFDAANAAGVKHIVFTSNRVAEPESGFVIDNPNHKRSMELHLRQSGYSYTTLRIPFMMENLLRDRDLQRHITDGTVDYGEEGTPGYYISSGDMGLFAAAAFADPDGWNGRELNMASDAVTPKQLSALLTKLSGIEIQHRTAPWSELRGPFVANFKWFEQGGATYDMDLLRKEFPTIQTLEEYLVSNGVGEKLRELEANPLPAQAPGGMGRR